MAFHLHKLMYNSNCNKLENLDQVKKLYFVVYENFLGLEE